MKYAPGDRTMDQIAAELGKSLDYVWDLRRQDPEFDALIRTAVAVVDEIRSTNVEDTTYMRIIKGEASAQEVIFWLKNRSPQRWKDKVERELTGKDGRPLVPVAVIRDLVGDEDTS